MSNLVNKSGQLAHHLEKNVVLDLCIRCLYKDGSKFRFHFCFFVCFLETGFLHTALEPVLELTL